MLFRELLYSIMFIVNTVLYTHEFAKRLDLTLSVLTKNGNNKEGQRKPLEVVGMFMA